MASLAENITQAIADFDGIKTAIESKGVTVGNAPTSQYADKIGLISGGDKSDIEKIVSMQKLADLQLTDRYRVEARLGTHTSRKIYIWYNVSGEIPFARRRDEYDTLFSVVYRDNIPVAAFAYTEMLEKSYDLQTGKCIRHTYENIGISERSGNNRWNLKYHHNDDTGSSADEWQNYISLMPWSETRTLYTVLSMDELTELADDFYKKVVWDYREVTS